MKKKYYYNLLILGVVQRAMTAVTCCVASIRTESCQIGSSIHQ